MSVVNGTGLVKRSAWLVATAVITALMSATPVGAAPTASPVRFASPTGAGSTCSMTEACSLQQAVDVASAGDFVVLQPGDYAPLTLRDASGHLSSASTNVVISAASPREVVLHGLDVYAPHLTFSGLRVVDNGLYVRPAATYTELVGIDFDGEGKAVANVPAVTLAGDHSRLTGSRLVGRVDGDLVFVGVGGHTVSDIIIDRNILGPADVGPAGNHVDCVQVATQASHVRIDSNYIAGCSNSGVIIKADHGPIDDVIVVNNVLRGCGSRSAQCAGYNALYVRENPQTHDPLTNVHVLRNTIDGWISIDAAPSNDVTGNIIGQVLKGQDLCGPWLKFNLITTTGCTRTLDPSNVVGQPVFVDAPAGDLRLAPGSPGVRLGGEDATAVDLDGYARTAPYSAGAWEMDTGSVAASAQASELAVGASTRVSGQMLADGQPAARPQTVELWTRPAARGNFSKVATSMTSTGGNFSFRRTLSRSTDYRLRVVPSPHTSAATRDVRVLAFGRLACPARVGARPGRVVLRCTVLPNLRRVATLQVRGGNGAWRSVSSASSTTRGNQQIVSALVGMQSREVQYRFLVRGDLDAGALVGPSILVGP